MPEPEKPEPIVERDFDDAEAFLEALHPLRGNWMRDPLLWIFRGQADSSWLLVPSAHRPESWAPYGFPILRPKVAGAPYHPVIDVEAEHWLYRRYMAGLDEAGLVIPETNTWGSPDGPFDRAKESWPGGHRIGVLALAQHYNLPTRLLDWTWKPRHAAFFAAQGAASEPSADKSLEVWALRTDFVREHGKRGINGITFSLLEVARANNPKLHAQSGLFTVCRGALEVGENPVALDQVVRLRHRVMADDKGTLPALAYDSPIMYRFRLPQHAAPALLRLLWFEDVNAARLFPASHEGILQSMKDEHRWDSPPTRAQPPKKGAS